MLAACPPAQVQHSWMPHFLTESPAPSALYAGQGTTPNPKAGIPHAYLRHPSGAFFHFLAHPLGQAPLPRVSVCPADTPPGPLPFPLRESARPSALEHPFLWGQESSSTRVWAVPHLGLAFPALPQPCAEPGGRKADRRVRGPPTSRAGASPPCSRTPRRVTVARRATSSFMVTAALAARLACERVICRV